VFFSDAVFAIAMTLLVLPLADARFDDARLVAQLVELLPKVFSFVRSFAVLGLYWVGHHRSSATSLPPIAGTCTSTC
jgi:uncharacterized membrane protein